MQRAFAASPSACRLLLLFVALFFIVHSVIFCALYFRHGALQLQFYLPFKFINSSCRTLACLGCFWHYEKNPDTNRGGDWLCSQTVPRDTGLSLSVVPSTKIRRK